MAASAWSRTSSRVVYENPWIRVREDEVLRPDGDAGVYGVVEVRHVAVFVVAVTDDDEVVLVAVDRYTTGDPASLEIPAGGSDGEEPLVAAQRELREETGLVAARWREIGRMNALVGVSDAREVVFLAHGLTYAGGEELAADGIVGVHRVPISALPERIARGDITDASSLAAILLALASSGRLG
ncbi:NUDIX domain-containing protein [Pimelobacter simplex]|uniref:NUDIX domain-containing protein n=1 Tax=Nocardioides simplex TaxID=2045 RepID=UPI003671D5D1